MPSAAAPPASEPDAPAPAPGPAPTEDRADLVVRRILAADDVPAFSRVMREVMDTAGRDGASAQHLANLVLRDYALTVRVIRAANSAHFNRSGRQVQSATHALMLLGARTVRELAAGLLLFEHYRRRSPGLKELLLLALLTASHARAAAERAGGADPETAHLCGMFRSLGEVLVAAHLPDDYAAVLRRAAERHAGRGRDADGSAARASAAAAVLGCTFEDAGVAVARHWGMPEAVRQGMRAAGAAGEGRLEAVTAFAHALTGAVYRADAAHAPAAADGVVVSRGARLGLSRADCREVADRAVADTRELFAAAGVRLDDLRLSRQVAAALAEPAAPALATDLPASPPAAAGSATAAALAGAAPTPPAGSARAGPGVRVGASAAELAALRAQLAPELAAAAADVAAFDAHRVVLMALEAVLRGGPFDRAALYAADAPAGAFRPRAALGEGADALLAGPPLPFAAAAGPAGPALLGAQEVHLAHGTRLTLGEARLLRDWDAVSALLLPVRVGGAVIGALHAARRTSFAAPDAGALAYVRDVAAAVERGLGARRAGAAPTDPPVRVAAVLRVLRGAPAEEVARDVGTDAATLAAWQAEFLAGAAARLGA